MTTIAQYEADQLAHQPSPAYERLVRLTQAVTGVPMVTLSLLGAQDRHTVAAVGLDPASVSQWDAICQLAAAHIGIFEISDLRLDPRFSHHPAVTGPLNLRYFAGVPVHSADGQVVGVLCILDRITRTLSRHERQMLTDLRLTIEAELATQAELLRAADVQRSLLPVSTPNIAGIEIAGRVVQARDSGGDFFDWQEIEHGERPNELQVVVADIMGKGLAASFIASEIRAVVRGHSAYAPVAATMGRVARTAKHDLEINGRFVTMWLGRINPVSGRVDYVDAGHGLAMIVAAAEVRRLAQRKLPLGMPVDQEWAQSTTYLGRGEVLLVVSDGVFDIFGSVDALTAAVPRLFDLAAPCAQIVDLVVDYATEHGTSDDCTALAMRRRPITEQVTAKTSYFDE